MSRNGVTCELVDQEDLDTRYLAGRLSPEGAEAFEEHFFGCERCWGLVQQGLAIRSALGPDAAATPLTTVASAPRRAYGGWWGLAAAAALAVVVLGTWWTGRAASTRPTEDVLRGGEARFEVKASRRDATLRAAWPRLPDADLYRVRLYRPDGTLVGEREVTDTAIALEEDSLPLPPGEAAFWQVQALDRLRNPIAGSELTKAVPPSPAP